jgi:hypothetical protein
MIRNREEERVLKVFTYVGKEQKVQVMQERVGVLRVFVLYREPNTCRIVGHRLVNLGILQDS